MSLAFVMLAEPAMPEREAILDAFAEFTAGRPYVEPTVDAAEREPVLSFNIGGQRKVVVALAPFAIPGSEAEEAASLSVSSFSGWRPSRSSAHIVVALRPAAEGDLDALSTFTSLVAAVTKCSPTAVGVYWGPATHDPEFVVSCAKDGGIISQVMLWVGVSMAKESRDTVSFLSVGMQDLGFKELLVSSRPENSSEGLESLFDLVAYVVERRAEIPEGDTIGRDSRDRKKVRYVPSPVNPTEVVMHVDLRR